MFVDLFAPFLGVDSFPVGKEAVCIFFRISDCSINVLIVLLWICCDTQSVLLIAVSCKCSTISLVTFVYRKKTHPPFQIDFYSTLLPYSQPGSHAREPREHPPGGVHAVPVQGPAHAPEPHGEHSVQPVPHRVSLDYGEFPQEV